MWRASRSASLASTNCAAVPRCDLVLERLFQLAVKRLLAPEIARLQQCRADRQIGLGVAQAFGDRARRLPDLEAEIPQQVEQELDDLLGMRRLLVGQQEQQIDIGIRAPARRGHSRRPRRSPSSRPRSGWRAGTRSRSRSRRAPGSAGRSESIARRRPAAPCRRPRSGGGFRRARAASAAFSGGSSTARSSRRGARCGNRPRQLLAERPPVDDVALPQDGGHASGSV